MNKVYLSAIKELNDRIDLYETRLIESDSHYDTYHARLLLMRNMIKRTKILKRLRLRHFRN